MRLKKAIEIARYDKGLFRILADFLFTIVVRRSILLEK